jgi:hypothetical protein
MILETLFSGIGTSAVEKLLNLARQRNDARLRAMIQEELEKLAHASRSNSVIVVNIYIGDLTQQVHRLAESGLSPSSIIEAAHSHTLPALLSTGSTPTSSHPPTDFKVTTIHNGRVIQQQDLPLTIMGTYSSKGSSGEVWAVLVDSERRYYIQNPPVDFRSGGTWTARNIRPLVGIVAIDFVFVDRAGNGFFENLVANKIWGAFPLLPDNSKILATISVTSQATYSP